MLCLKGCIYPSCWEKGIGHRGVGQYHHQPPVHSGASARRRWSPSGKAMALSFHLGSSENKKSSAWWFLGATSPLTAERCADAKGSNKAASSCNALKFQFAVLFNPCFLSGSVMQNERRNNQLQNYCFTQRLEDGG